MLISLDVPRGALSAFMGKPEVAYKMCFIHKNGVPHISSSKVGVVFDTTGASHSV